MGQDLWGKTQREGSMGQNLWGRTHKAGSMGQGQSRSPSGGLSRIYGAEHSSCAL